MAHYTDDTYKVRKWSLPTDMVIPYTKDKNERILREREHAFNKRKGIREGDYIKEKNGNLTRVTYIWRDENDKPMLYQTGGNEYSRYYLGDGYLSYSGGLDHGYEPKNTKFRKLPIKKYGSVWFFKDNISGAGRGVEYIIKFRVFEVV